MGVLVPILTIACVGRHLKQAVYARLQASAGLRRS